MGNNNLLGGISSVSSYWKRNDAVSGSRASAASRPVTSAIDSYSTSKAKYHNTCAYRGASASKEGLRSITSTGMLGHSKMNKGPGATSRQDQQSRSKNPRALRAGVTATGTGSLLVDAPPSDGELNDRGARLKLSRAAYEGGREGDRLEELSSGGAPNTVELLKNSRDGSVTEQMRARDRHASTVMSTTSIRHTIHSGKPSGRHQMVLRNREKSASTAAHLRQSGQGASQSAFKKLRDIRDIRDAKSAAEVRQIMHDVKARYKNTGNNVSLRTQVHTTGEQSNISDLSKPNMALDRVTALRSSHNHSAFAYGKTRI